MRFSGNTTRLPMRSVNPYTGHTLAEYAPTTPAQLEGTLQASTHAFAAWRKHPLPKRAEMLLRLADLLDARREEYAQLATAEMGKTIKEARAEIEKSALNCRHYAAHMEGYLSSPSLSPVGGTAHIQYDPIGAVLAVMPWNFPFWQVLRCAAPIITAGNVFVLKHAGNVSGCALALQEMFETAGYPQGVFQTILIEGKKVAALLNDPRIAAATLTGSEAAGRSIAEAAGRNGKKTVLELGGSDPFIVLPDVDIATVAKAAAKARCVNNGQSCIAAKRFIIQRPQFQAFADAMFAAMQAMPLGNPAEETTQIGPLARPEFVADLQRQVDESVAAGATFRPIGLNGQDPEAFANWGLLLNPPPASPGFREELFGPVAVLFAVDTVEEAIKLANATDFGLGASVWGADVEAAKAVASQITAGCVYVNTAVSSQPPCPLAAPSILAMAESLVSVALKSLRI